MTGITSEELSAMVGILLSLGFSYIPGVRDRFGELEPTHKRLAMLGLLLACALGVFCLGCLQTGILPATPCNQAGAWSLARCIRGGRDCQPGHLSNFSQDMTDRKRGGQAGNTNALKHGFYSRHFKPIEDADLETALIEGLQNEVQMLRVMIRRVVDLSSKGEAAANLETAISSLNSLGIASTRLASLLKMERLIGGKSSQVSEVLTRALDDVLSELRVNK